MGSLIVSSFQFLSYKIDKMSLEIADNTNVLMKKFDSRDDWSFSVRIRPPLYFVSEKIYIGGLDICVHAGEKESPDVFLHAGIAGVFKVVGGDIPADREEKVAKNQIPALLSPYLRAGITGVLALSGFSSVVLPLFNFNKLAEDQLKDVEIKRIQDSIDESKPEGSVSN